MNSVVRIVGIHLLQTGEVITDLRFLADQLKLTFIPDLIAAKIAEKTEFGFETTEHLERLADLEQKLANAFEQPRLPENPQHEFVDERLVKIPLT